MRRSIFLFAVFAAALALPLIVTGDYYQRLINTALVFSLLTISLNIVLGYAGQLSLGHAGLFGIGAYVTALITSGHSGLLFWPAFVASGVATGVVGLMIGIPALRLKGHYLALATLGFGEIMRNIFFSWREVTHGMDGIGDIPPPSLGFFAFAGDTRFYYLGLFFLCVAMVLVLRLERSKYGRMLAAIRDAELAAGVVGVDVPRLKIIAFCASAVLAGFAGALYANLIGYISPDAFVLDVSVQALSMLLIGGIGTVWGPVVGATVLTFLPEMLRVSKEYYQLIYGAGIAIMVIFFPTGLVGWLKARWSALKAPAETSGDGGAGLADPPVPGNEASSRLGIAKTSAPGAPVMTVEGVSMRFGGLLALNELSLEVREGEIHALIGPNGSGKSTFINVASGLYTPSGGQLRFAGAEIAGARPWHIANLGLTRTFQNLRLFRSLTVLENVLVGCRVANAANWFGVLADTSRARAEDADLRQAARQALEFVGLSQFADRAIGTLPHERQRVVEIARAIAMRPRLLMLDEPAAGLNPAEVERLSDRIRQLRDAGVTILLVEHNMPLVMGLADRITVLNHGRKIAEGDPGSIRDNPQVIEAYLGHGTRKRLMQNVAS